MVENTWNVSFRKMYCLPRNTRKFLVEPVSQSIHIKKLFIKHFLTFVDKIKSSKKVALKNVFRIVKNDCRSVTGSNLRNIMLLVDKTKIEDLCEDNYNKVSYHEIPQGQFICKLIRAWTSEAVFEFHEFTSRIHLQVQQTHLFLLMLLAEMGKMIAALTLLIM